MKGSIIKRGKKYSLVIDIGKDINGKRMQKWYSGFKTKKEAQAAQLKILNELMYGTFVSPEELTLEEYLLEWLNDYVKLNLKETTYCSYKNNIEKHIIPYLGKTKVQELRATSIQSLYAELRRNGRHDGKGGLASKTVLQIHRILSKALDRAYRQRLINTKETDYVDLPKIEKYDSKILAMDDIPIFLAGFKNSDIYIGVLLGLNLGMRRGEVLGLRWQDIDLTMKTISVEQTLVVTEDGPKFSNPKTSSSNRTILISDDLINELHEIQAKQCELKMFFMGDYKDNDLVCCKPNGEPFHPGRFSKKFSKQLKNIGLENIRFHDLRHTNATLMLKANIPAKVASQRLGHSTIGITMDLYSKVLTEMQDEAANKLSKLIYYKD